MTDLADRRGIETDVYQPAEDSHLLATVAAEQVDEDNLVLEVGTGSGYVAERVAGETGARVVASDLNPHACRAARDRGVEVVRADLLDPIRTDTCDVVLFNPPYLPTEEGEEWDDWMEVALSGGETGRAVIDPFLGNVGRVLAPDGYVLLLVSSLTGVEAVVETAAESGFSAVALRDESYPFESLTVLKLHR
ncbi:HemK2/MTQ2 family protein methyltransferase [Natranaeroarchaeum sulfidigenes]|uniref:Methylase of polypeptide chain release factors n=1 Tax=Natranaeroarchaeum sulfidigenes TaxID=2784880 RepID=A0A897MQ45_9EURY|nr:HemK2/MTQ2 family protein methyltransferase [Natranaeroarchaeum sulfidigenes]QSG02714.1 Methylase of polypeptide chain release factors [Natranaeroarchaeum sulfidigenes]